MSVTPEHAAAQFEIEALTAPPVPQPGGHIHRNWIVATRLGRFFLQKLNTSVFADIDLLQGNTARIAECLREHHLVSPPLVFARDGRSWWPGDDGSAWRVFEFLEGRRQAGPADARAVGDAFGRFAAALAGFDGPPLRPTIPGFHDLPARWQALVAAESEAPPDRLRASEADRARVEDHEHLAGTFAGLPSAVAHGDAKAANVLLDPTGTHAPVVVDLDTTGPAPLEVDAGDLIRSCAVRAAEDEPDLDRVTLDDGLLLAVIGGWLGSLPDRVVQVIPAGQAICWEQAVRFLTDYLTGDRYYPVAHPAQNLERARTQLRLLQQLVDRADELEAAVARLQSGRR